MSKNKIILSTLLLFAIMLPCFLSISQINNIEINFKQNNTNLNDISTPKPSGYAVTERWNDTTTATVNVVAVSADGKYMAVGTNWAAAAGDYGIFFYNTSNHDGIPMWIYDPGYSYDSLAISADGSYIIAGSSSSNIATLLNSSVPAPGINKEPIWWIDHGTLVSSVDISADGKYIVAGVGQAVYVYNNSYASTGFFTDKTNEYEWTNATGDDPLHVAISSDGKYVVCGAHTSGNIDSIVFWNNTEYDYNQDHLPMWTYDTGIAVESVAISAKGEYVVAGTGFDGGGPELFVFNKSAKGGMPQFTYDTWYILSVAISADGEYIVAGSDESGIAGVVELFSNSKSKREWVNSTQGIVKSVDITADGKYIVVGTEYNRIDDSYDENTVFLYNRSGTDEHSPEWAFNTSENVDSVSIDSWGNYIAAGGPYGIDGRAYLFYHARPIPKALAVLLGDDDDDDDEEEIIPFGNFYLLFAMIAIAALILLYKRKAIFIKK